MHSFAESPGIPAEGWLWVGSAGTRNPAAVGALQTVAGNGRGLGRMLCLGN